MADSMRTALVGAVFVGAVLGSMPETGAVPFLQLSADQSTHDAETETVFATGDPFAVYAWVAPGPNYDINAFLSREFYTSTTVAPQSDGLLSPTLGSLALDATTQDAVSNPDPRFLPLEGLRQNVAQQSGDHGQGPRDRPSCGVLPTDVTVFQFTYANPQQAELAETEADPALAAIPGTDSGADPYRVAFTVDASALVDGCASDLDVYETMAQQLIRGIREHQPATYTLSRGGVAVADAERDRSRLLSNAHSNKVPSPGVRLPENRAD